jgi:toxin-antitoxin system PIN domain toxin
LTDLPDINVWLALVDKRHVHHQAASHYWETRASESLAFCRVTAMGFLRLSTHARALANPLSPQEAWTVYQQFLAIPILRFLAELAGLDEHFNALTGSHGFPHHLWTGAYLAAFCLEGNYRLVSFDNDYQRFPALNFLDLSATDSH